MTAKEIVSESLSNKEMIHDPINRDWWIDSLEHKIKEYARKKCEEQRDLCQKVHDEGNPKVRNAPEPTFE